MASTVSDDDTIIGLHDGSIVDSDNDTATLVHTSTATDDVSSRGTDTLKIRRTESEPNGGYQSQRAEPRRPGRSRTSRTQADIFIDALKAYQLTSKDLKIQSFDLEGKHSWDEVLRLVNDSQTLYKEAGKRPWRRLGRFLGRQAENVHPWLRLIPNNDTASIVCGGLKCIFEAAIHIEEGREEVLATLLRVPDIILEGEHSLENFGNDLVLGDKVEELNITILEALGSAVELLGKNPFRKQGRALTTGQAYNRSFRRKVEEMERALGALQARVDFLRSATAIHTRKTTDNIHVIVRDVQRTNSLIDERSERTLSLSQVLKSAAEQQGKDLNDLKSGQKDTRDRINDVKSLRRDINEVLKLSLKTAKCEYRRKDNAERVIRRMQKQLKGFQVAIHGLTEADLLRILDYDEEVVVENFRIVHAQCQSQGVALADVELAQGLLQSTRFTGWFEGPDSSALFIERMGSTASPNAFSPVSILSCSVIEEVGQDQSACIFHHFCGQHAAKGDDKCGPQGLLRSIIFQMLQHFPQRTNAGFISRREAREQLESGNIRSLCLCLASILSQLPPETVIFCIIDGIDSFETEPVWKTQCKHIMRALLDIIHDDESYPVFKLLLTSSTRSKEIGNVFPNEMRMYLLPEGSSGRDNPTERDISLGTRRLKVKESDSYRRLKAQIRRPEEDTSDSGTDWSSDGDNSRN